MDFVCKFQSFPFSYFDISRLVLKFGFQISRSSVIYRSVIELGLQSRQRLNSVRVKVIRWRARDAEAL